MDGKRAIWNKEGSGVTRKINYMFQDGVALIRNSRAWCKNRWTYSISGGMDRGMQQGWRGVTKDLAPCDK